MAQKPYFESEHDLLFWLLNSVRDNPLANMLQQVKVSSLDDEQASFTKEYMALINSIQAEEKIGNLDMDIAKEFFADEVLQHSAIGVGHHGFGFRMARSQFAETTQNVYKKESFGDVGEEQKKQGFDFSKIPKPNPDSYKNPGIKNYKAINLTK